jgi:hypothetical protein
VDVSAAPVDSADPGAGTARITMISSRSTVTCGAVVVHSLGSRSPNQAVIATAALSDAAASGTADVFVM